MKGPWEGDWPLSAGWLYSSGALHASWDIAMPRGTALYAIGDGVIVDCNKGEPDPAKDRFVGMPSNWIILRFTAPDGSYKGQTLHAYYQHLTDQDLGGVLVNPGQTVKAGDLIGHSGNSGNSTGAHLHLTVIKPGFIMNEASRYAYLTNPSIVVWPISDAWGDYIYEEEEDMPLSDKDIERIAALVNKTLGDWNADGSVEEGKDGDRADQRLRQIEASVRRTEAKVKEIEKKVDALGEA